MQIHKNQVFAKNTTHYISTQNKEIMLIYALEIGRQMRIVVPLSISEFLTIIFPS